MNKAELIAALAMRTKMSKADAGRTMEALFDDKGIIAGELKKGAKVQITGFGNFEARKRAQRQGRRVGILQRRVRPATGRSDGARMEWLGARHHEHPVSAGRGGRNDGRGPAPTHAQMGVRVPWCDLGWHAARCRWRTCVCRHG